MKRILSTLFLLLFLASCGSASKDAKTGGATGASSKSGAVSASGSEDPEVKATLQDIEKIVDDVTDEK